MQPDPNTPKTGTGKYVFDPVTRQYKWVPDPIKPVDIAPVFENKDTPLNHGKSDADRAEQQAKINAYFDNMTPEQKKNNVRMALILASVVVVFFFGIIVKVVLLGRP
jgi:hypothetical protein